MQFYFALIRFKLYAIGIRRKSLNYFMKNTFQLLAYGINLIIESMQNYFILLLINYLTL